VFKEHDKDRAPFSTLASWGSFSGPPPPPIRHSLGD